MDRRWRPAAARRRWPARAAVGGQLRHHRAQGAGARARGSAPAAGAAGCVARTAQSGAGGSEPGQKSGSVGQCQPRDPHADERACWGSPICWPGRAWPGAAALCGDIRDIGSASVDAASTTSWTSRGSRPGRLDLERIDFALAAVLEQVRSLLAPQAVERGLELRGRARWSRRHSCCAATPTGCARCWSTWSATGSSSRPGAASR